MCVCVCVCVCLCLHMCLCLCYQKIQEKRVVYYRESRQVLNVTMTQDGRVLTDCRNMEFFDDMQFEWRGENESQIGED